MNAGWARRCGRAPGVIHRGADAKSGKIQRITITKGDHPVFEWTYGKGITFK